MFWHTLGSTYYFDKIDLVIKPRAQVSAGVFTRSWSKASVSVDCNTMEGTITLKPQDSE
jgi:hypothetical protein